MKSLPALIVILALGCAKQETAGVDLLKQVTAEAKEKPRVEVKVKMAGDERTPADDALLRSLESKIEDQHVGRLVSSGYEPGYMTVTVEVDNTADAIATLRKVLLDAGVLKDAGFRVLGGA